MTDVLILIPAYNEEKNIGKVLDDLLRSDLPADIAVINDGSTDRTQSVAAEKGVYVITHPCNLGYGAALQTGFKFAMQMQYNYIVQFDADGQHHPEDLRRVIEEIRKDEDDVVIGSRYLGDANYDPGMLKKIAIIIFTRIIYLLTKAKITDPTSGLRGLSANLSRYYGVAGRFPCDYPDADAIIHMLLNRFKIREIPVRAQDRLHGKSLQFSGIKPVVYFFKMFLSIIAVLLYHVIVYREESK